MIIYENNKQGFINDVRQNKIVDLLLESFIQKNLGKIGQSEQNSWSNSFRHMKDIVDSPIVSDDIYICLEYKLNSSAKRIDFIVAGEYDNNKL